MDKTVQIVIDRYKERSATGIKKYNTTLDKNNLPLIDWLNHSIEEKMDDVLYMQRAIQEIEKTTNEEKCNCAGMCNSSSIMR